MCQEEAWEQQLGLRRGHTPQRSGAGDPSAGRTSAGREVRVLCTSVSRGCGNRVATLVAQNNRTVVPHSGARSLRPGWARPEPAGGTRPCLFQLLAALGDPWLWQRHSSVHAAFSLGLHRLPLCARVSVSQSPHLIRALVMLRGGPP